MFSLNKFFITELKSDFKEKKIFGKLKRKVFILFYYFTGTEILHKNWESFLLLKVSFLIIIAFNIYIYIFVLEMLYIGKRNYRYLCVFYKYSDHSLMRFSLIRLIRLYDLFWSLWRPNIYWRDIGPVERCPLWGSF